MEKNPPKSSSLIWEGRSKQKKTNSENFVEPVTLLLKRKGTIERSLYLYQANELDKSEAEQKGFCGSP